MHACDAGQNLTANMAVMMLLILLILPHLKIRCAVDAGAGLCGRNGMQSQHAAGADADKLPDGLWGNADLGAVVPGGKHLRLLQAAGHQASSIS